MRAPQQEKAPDRECRQAVESFIDELRPYMTAALLLNVLLGGLLTGTNPANAFPAPEDDWLSYDVATNTVTFELIAGPFTFNGYRDGGATLLVPAKATIVMKFVNKDGTAHSALVIGGAGAIPSSPGDPAIPRAYTNKALEGLPQEATDVMRFPVPDSGIYRIVCGVPGHGLSGMWIWLKVDPAAKQPAFGPTKA